MRLVFLLLVAALAACNNNADTEAIVDPVPDTSASREPAPVIISDSTPVNRQVDSVIRFRFDRDSSTLTATGTLHKAGDKVVGYLPADRELDLTALLVPSDNKMNIRFSQIVLPDGKSDGPFGQKLEYKISQQGTYQLVISSSNMAQGKTSGDFTIRLSVTPDPHK